MKRAAALLVDGSITNLFSLTFYIPFVIILFILLAYIPDPYGGPIVLYIFVLIIFLIPYVYVVWCTSRYGGTPGKLMVGLRTVDKDNNTLTQWHVFLREMAKLLTILPFGLGYLWALWDKEKKTLYDHMVKTSVIEPELSDKTH